MSVQEPRAAYGKIDTTLATTAPYSKVGIKQVGYELLVVVIAAVNVNVKQLGQVEVNVFVREAKQAIAQVRLNAWLFAVK